MRSALLATLTLLLAACRAGAPAPAPVVSPASSPTSPSPSPSTFVRAATQTTAVGSLLTLARTTDATVNVNVLEVLDPARLSETAPPGRRYVAIRIELSNPDGPAYVEQPYNGLRVIDDHGAGHEPADTARPADPLPRSFRIARGAFVRGAVVFSMPSQAEVRAVRFTPAGDTAPDTGEWTA